MGDCMDTSRIGFSCISSLADPSAWVYGLEELGFSAWEYVADGDDALIPQRLSLLRDVRDTTSLTITVHAPFSDLNMASLIHRIWEDSVEAIMETMRLTAELSEMITVHPGHLSPYAMGRVDLAKQRLIEALERLSGAAEEYGFTLGVENMPEFKYVFCRTRDEVEEVIEAVDSPHLGITLDVGHANTTGTLDDFLRSEHIVHAHIHDNMKDHDSHLTIGEGSIEWGAVMDSLLGRNITMIIEARTLESGAASLEFLRSL
ncbi:sugar phosphate isomerase/epimerase family protein [Methermicoccus shengliensis]|uniref:Sugar phosphate isomerase/epimerase n=1 Tax=Methermicoccus shengliensis TaxID=660064 RepID=A0A832RS42_9EURY|nr:sugar phosphate isomerase/epimerase family protein [Methermicoccus shengliensis]KUK30287.1 MAG: Sugar phosphate isomerase/epimerase [Methanosarcinales archeaon 56_1174]MDI3488118.1 hypothetical protein [Methanosarcinales archaeon]HIH69208.1 sugar phosphate isomerase/epimerase [Methermicoccus shengliensis]